MRRKVDAALMVAGLLAATASAMAAPAARPLVGGYSEAAVSETNVAAAVAFAITAEEKTLREKGDEAPARLELVAILHAQQQVVAGMNYRLTLKVKQNGRDREAEAVVWWQAWRSPDPYQLTSWKWK